MSMIRKSDQDQGSVCIQDQDSECDQGQGSASGHDQTQDGHAQDSGCDHNIALFGDQSHQNECSVLG